MNKIMKIILTLVISIFFVEFSYGQVFIPHSKIEDHFYLSNKVTRYLSETIDKKNILDKEERKKKKYVEMEAKLYSYEGKYLSKLERIYTKEDAELALSRIKEFQNILDSHSNKKIKNNTVFYTEEYQWVEEGEYQTEGTCNILKKLLQKDFLNLTEEELEKDFLVEAITTSDTKWGNHIDLRLKYDYCWGVYLIICENGSYIAFHTWRHCR
jgi:hypothetical protein